MEYFLQLCLQLLLVAAGIYLALVPLFILREFRRQGEARREETQKIITLLSRINESILVTDSRPHRSFDAKKLQVGVDACAIPESGEVGVIHG